MEKPDVKVLALTSVLIKVVWQALKPHLIDIGLLKKASTTELNNPHITVLLGFLKVYLRQNEKMTYMMQYVFTINLFPKNVHICSLTEVGLYTWGRIYAQLYLCRECTAQPASSTETKLSH